MPRARSEQPAYLYHISGQAKARLGGDDFYLGSTVRQALRPVG